VRPTLKDVAVLAGVSTGTASRALSGRGAVRPETRQRVLNAVDALGFRPNQHARSLLSGRSWTVGLITTDGLGRFSIPVLLGAEGALGAGEISVLLCDTRGDLVREQHHVRSLLARQVDGIVVADPRTGPRPPLRGVGSTPTVYAISPSTAEGDISVVSDEGAGVRAALGHLIALGRSRVAHVTGPAHHAAARRRAADAVRTLAEAGLELAGGRPFHGSFSEAWGRRAAGALLRITPDMDAVFCGNDEIARGVGDTLRENGVHVPDQVAVVGYDNWETMALAARPPLTTVDMNLAEIGRISALRLLEAIDGEPAPGVHTAPVSLIVRESA
jgi:LacI family transcriptional regulator